MDLANLIESKKGNKKGLDLHTNEKNAKKQVSDRTIFFFSKSLLMNIHMTDHIYKIAVRRKCV